MNRLAEEEEKEDNQNVLQMKVNNLCSQSLESTEKLSQLFNSTTPVAELRHELLYDVKKMPKVSKGRRELAKGDSAADMPPEVFNNTGSPSSKKDYDQRNPY